MKRYIIRLLLVYVCSSLLFSACSQNSSDPFKPEIDAFKAADKKSFPPSNAILFIGSSSFTMWTDVQTYFPGYTIINRGFGGSGLNDVIKYAQDIILPYHPKQVVIYCGENDVATGTVTATDVLQRFTQLFNIIRNKMPEASVVYVSMKPSPSREKFMPIFEDGNKMIREFLSGYPKTGFVDVYHLMLTADGKTRPELYRDDQLHMKPEGYAIWKQAILPFLLK
ncbi:MAG TPA: GDSL-type esterase/lipase family protein [Flavitalea sp.]|nr:GDSL-type esterase/lipase family protein [Flavitalea sp.]